MLIQQFNKKILDLIFMIFSNIYFNKLPIKNHLNINLALSFGYLLFGIMLRIVVQLLFIVLFQLSLIGISAFQVFFYIEFTRMLFKKLFKH